ncbi:hypothetical protein VitviT2T_022130 [Vitis vinifera]|uniref:Histone-lysine N-methyltransferase, H3 lysine-9 specific SUVH4 n=1 Tax=Vitis vinifera TaxID=29760 RepID=A0ABY9DAZ0_VITVI|eukprot:XP_010660678.1 PREDICTED: histone-lysine N-methyltransferase, H3 lysine-9 specific SUVH4 [Vitis vinifera]
MVVPSLHCMNNTVANGGVDQELTTDNQHSMASGGSSMDNRRKSKSSVKSEKKTLKVESDDTHPVERRSSARIQKLKSEKASSVYRLEESPNSRPEQCSRKKTKVYQRRKANTHEGSEEVVGEAVSPTEGSSEAMDSDCVENGESTNPVLMEVAANGIVNDVSTTNVVEKSVYAKVKETLRTFNKYYLHFVQKGDAPEKDGRQGSRRPDLKAISKMMETNAILYPEKRFGPIPGVDVGHQFFSRAEMVAVGFHSHWLNGIDYMGQSYNRREYSGYTFPLAVAIVLSGQYEDDLDNSEDVVYTGQGGNNLLGNKRQVQDQVMERGNLALKNCMEQCVPVRVIRGHKSANSYVGKVYTYDGLYKVVQYWAEKGVSGFTVFKYRLKRLEGQPILTTNQVQYARGRVPNSISEIRGLVCEDISGGQEDIPIPATNLVDDPPFAPTGFTYCNSIKVSKSVKLPSNAIGCNCKGTCTDPRTCSCAMLNGSDFPYVHRDGGRLIEAKDVVFECGPKCGCGPGCLNRTSQRGLKYRLEVFRTPKKGWAVRSWDYIPSGAPICEYKGILMRTDELDNVSDNNYIFDIDCLQTMRGLDGRERRFRDVSMPTSTDDQKSESVPEFCIDAGSTGNVARFINHSCEPNLFVQCVLSSHHDAKLARVMLFAADNIPPLQELTYDYGYTLDSVMGPDGKIKQMLCFCGAADCRKRLL